MFSGTQTDSDSFRMMREKYDTLGTDLSFSPSPILITALVPGCARPTENASLLTVILDKAALSVRPLVGGRWMHVDWFIS